MYYLNLKEDYPPVDVALAMVEIEIERYTGTGERVIKVLHGYGSHGIGGDIKRNLQIALARWKQKGFIFDYYSGEVITKTKLDDYNLDVKVYNSIVLDEDFLHYNPGITYIVLNKEK